MFALKSTPSTASILSLYTTLTATAMLIRGVVTELQSIAGQLIPHHIQAMLLSKLAFWLGGKPPSHLMTLYIHEHSGGGGGDANELYEASEIYLGTKVTSTATAPLNKLKVSKSPRDKALALNIDSDDNIDNTFGEIQLHWRITSIEAKEHRPEKKVIELSFDKKFLENVVASYLPHVLERSKAIQEANKAVRLYSLGNCFSDYDGEWTFTNLDHPSTFDTLAMDPKLKTELIADLDRFVRRGDYYRRVGKAWKRGYLLYGPPGTGKSSLIAAMANYLKFSIYDLELTSVYDNSYLRRLLASTKNRSIVVIEDIDCSAEFKDRQGGDGYSDYNNNNNRRDSHLTLSGLLNFIDGLYSSCGDERIIVFTTNHKDKLDPALLRPGRMDMHIHMSYCSPSGFRVLASNYLGVSGHDLFAEIDELMREVEVTPAQIAEELMKSEDVDIALGGLLKFLEGKKGESGINNSEEEEKKEEKKEEEGETETGSEREGGGTSSGNDKKAVKRRHRRRLKVLY